MVAPASGGGLIAGVATAVKARFPEAMLMSASRKASTIMRVRCAPANASRIAAEGRTICDALMASIPGELTFAINSRLLAQGSRRPTRKSGPRSDLPFAN